MAGSGKDKIIRLKTVLERCGISRSTIYRKMQEGTFPKQESLSEHCAGWKESEIDRWIANPSTYRQPEVAAAAPIVATHSRAPSRPN